MFCETCGRRRYRNVERKPRLNNDGSKRQLNLKGLWLNLWRYTYICKECGEVKLLIIGHGIDDPDGQRALHFLWGFLLKFDDDMVNPIRTAIWWKSGET